MRCFRLSLPNNPVFLPALSHWKRNSKTFSASVLGWRCIKTRGIYLADSRWLDETVFKCVSLDPTATRPHFCSRVSRSRCAAGSRSVGLPERGKLVRIPPNASSARRHLKHRPSATFLLVFSISVGTLGVCARGPARPGERGCRRVREDSLIHLVATGY
jgi:hypothetical protein